MARKKNIEIKKPSKEVLRLSVFDQFAFLDKEKYKKGMKLLQESDINNEIKNELIALFTTRYSGIKSNAMSKYIVDRGIKPKKYKDNIDEIKKDLETMSQRDVANKWDCSTRTIYQISKNIYL